jgi:hypothetical protein
MLKRNNRGWASTAAALLVLFVLATIKGGFVVALLAVTCGVIGWINVFGAFQSVVWRLRGHKLPLAAGAIAAASVPASALIVWVVYGWVLLLIQFPSGFAQVSPDNRPLRNNALVPTAQTLAFEFPRLRLGGGTAQALAVKRTDAGHPNRNSILLQAFRR